MKLFLSLIVLCLLAVPAMALPDHAMLTTYFDECGTEIGWRQLSCNGQFTSSGTTTSDYYSVEVLMECNNWVEPLGCGDMGLTTVGQSGCSSWCVSSGYSMSYGANLAPDCGGRCANGSFTLPCPGW
ncbi:MAG TPA: hypothetical protein VE974_25445 [Thermoanaerobaculia bacterium]|nr:hypothetical protein [Thermoanaerobaculia bacterium]